MSEEFFPLVGAEFFSLFYFQLKKWGGIIGRYFLNLQKDFADLSRMGNWGFSSGIVGTWETWMLSSHSFTWFICLFCTKVYSFCNFLFI